MKEVEGNTKTQWRSTRKEYAGMERFACLSKFNFEGREVTVKKE